MADKEITGWNGLGEPDYQRLAAACKIISDAFNESCWLVGSATESRDYRDVDVRLIMSDEKYDLLFGDKKPRNDFWTLTMMGINAYLEKATGLPVDFQIQRNSWVKDDDWNKVREPLRLSDVARPEWSLERRA